MSITLLIEYRLVFLSSEGGCTCSSESTLVKIPNCWKSHVTAQFFQAELARNDKAGFIAPKNVPYILSHDIFRTTT